MNELKDQVGIITGAASGIGFAIAKKLLIKGVKLALLDKAEVNHSDLKGFEDQVATFKVDLTNEESVKQTIEAVTKQFGKIDLLVNSAGITGQTNIKSHEVEAESLRSVFEVNFMGPFYTSKYVIPEMLKRKYGRILHIASIAGKEGNAGMLAYSASKAALIGMTKVQGKEYCETGITINALAPAVIHTALVDNMPEEQVKYMMDKIPMKRFGTLEEVTNMACYIISPENSFTTGFTFDLSGGRATY